MCGILGILLSNNSHINPDNLKHDLSKLFLLSESRGKESSGLCVNTSRKTSILKKPIPASKLIKSHEYKDIFSGLMLDQTKESLSLIGHCRLVTNGSQLNEKNNQPVHCKKMTGVHNGIIINDAEIYHHIPTYTRESQLDSEALAAYLDFASNAGHTMSKSIQDLFSLIEGAASVAFLNHDSNEISLATNTGSLYYLFNEDLFEVAFASERHILEDFLESSVLFSQNNVENIFHLKPGCGIIFNLNHKTTAHVEISLSNFTSKEPSFAKNIRKIRATNLDFDQHDKISPIRRCSRCILPITMPFIEFDEDGVCNYCTAYKKHTLKREEELLMYLDKIRSKTGEPDCIVTFSGGRDSSYGLHLLKTKYNLNPVAFTYDWGMVTDLARRNQARVCGKLGVEHIILSANIDKKRKNIGKNIDAWLRRPELGMIPLFMAGDKEFFYHFNNLRKKMKIEPVALCVNPFERTDFKTGFCGIKQNQVMPYKNVFAVLGYYLKNFVLNPAYFNSSLFDTFFAFYSSFIVPKDYFMPFDYIEWNEDKINDVLLSEYNWETSPDTPTTWRIGDGTAAFYNYIYFTVAGFTENDTLRSNQIREGIITRNQGLNLIAIENMPRWDSIKEYLKLVNLDFETTIQKIRDIKKVKLLSVAT